MGLYLKQQLLSWVDSFYAYDEAGNERYRIQGEVFSWGKKLHIYDLDGTELAYIEQKLASFLPRYTILRDGEPVTEVVKQLTLFRQEYRAETLGWTVQGDFWAHEYRILCGETPVAAVNKEWFAFGDAYHIDIAEGGDEVLVLSVLLVVDACIEMAEN